MFAFQIGRWWRGATGELVNYYDEMDITQWGIVAALVVLTGFMFLRSGTQIR